MKPLNQLTQKEKLGLHKSPGKGMMRDTAILLYRLKDDHLYTLSDMAATMYKHGEGEHYRMVNRLKSFVRNRCIKPDEGANAWLGRTVKEHLDPRYYYMAEQSLALVAALNRLADQKRGQLRSVETKPISSHKSRRPSIFRKKWRSFAAAASFLVVLSLTSAAISLSHVNFFEILKTQGLNAAIRAIADADMSSPEGQFQIAWVEYREAEYKTARNMANHILSLSNIGDKTRADCHYLLSELDLIDHDYYRANQEAQSAFKIYNKLGLIRNMHHTAVLKADIANTLGDYDRSKDMLKLALKLYKNDVDGTIESLGNYTQAEYSLAFWTGKSKKAIKLGIEQVEIYEESGENDMLPSAYSNLGLAYALSGDTKQGLYYTLKAQDLLYDLKDDRIRTFNYINMIVLQRNLGQEPDPKIVERVVEWSTMEHDPEILKYLSLALNHEIEETINDCKTRHPE